MKKPIALILVLALALSLAACGGPRVSSVSSSAPSSVPAPPSSSAASSQPASTAGGKQGEPIPLPTDIIPRVYSITLADNGRESVIVDQDGKEIMRGANLEILHDILTGEPKAILQRRNLYPPYDAPLEDWFGDCESALYSLSGEILQDWSPGVFGAGFGTYVIRANRWAYSFELSPKPPQSDDVESALVDMYTGKVVLENANRLNVFSNGLMSVSDGFTELGIIDAKLNRIAGFPMRRNYYGIFEWDGRYLANAAEPQAYDGRITGYVLGADFSEQAAFPGWQLSGGMGGGYLMRHETRELVDADTGEAVIDFNVIKLGYASYYDGKAMISSQYGPGEKYTLSAGDGTVIADGFDELYPMPQHFTTESTVFVGIRDGRLLLVNRAGIVLDQSAPGPYKSVYYYGPDSEWMALPESRLIVEGADSSSPEDSCEALYDMGLNEIIPLGVYKSLYPLSGYPVVNAITPVPFLSGTRKQGEADGASSIDIIDFNGNVVLEGLSSIGYGADSQRLIATRGGFIGLMDYAGNWLWKEPAPKRDT